MFGLRSIPGKRRNRGLAWKAGFLVGVVLSGVTMMTALRGVPLRLQAINLGPHLAGSYFQDPSGKASTYNTNSPIQTANHPFAELPANSRMETNMAGQVFSVIDGSRCRNLPQKKANAHSLPLHKGLYRIYLPLPAKDVNSISPKPALTMKAIRDSIGCNTESTNGKSKNTAISAYRKTAW